LAYSLRGVKNYNKRKSEGKDFGLMTGRKRRVHFFGKGYCKNLRERSNEEKEGCKGLIAKLKCQ
jgi:hypothetical protein